MNDVQKRNAAKKFAEFWKGKGYEKGQSQPFWLQLLGEVYGIEHPAQFISFEDQVMLDHKSFIDGYIAETKVMIEQKSLGKDLLAPIRQSDGTLLKPIEQAKRYAAELPVSKHPKYIVTCNFEKFLVYDMEHPHSEPQEILLENLPEEYYRLEFLVNNGTAHIHKEMQVSMAAGELVGKLYEAFLNQYRDKSNEESLRSLNKLCVRLVFCLYAEDAGIFGQHDMFHDYLASFDTKHMRTALIELFRVLDQPPEERDPYLEETLAAFPYVNGGLFADDNIEIPQFTDEIRELLLEKASFDFNWSEISPTIFGAVFESTLNPETRRKGGMHYTSIENIHKVIDPLFLDELKDEFTRIKNNPVKKTRKTQLEVFQKKLAGLKFLDPACGSGNFLTETYICLRKLENEIIRLLTGGEMYLGEFLNPIQVKINQFYGIEINDFAVSVAKTALWIAESQMMKETEDIVHMTIDFLPLKTYTNIHEGNALRIDWSDVIKPHELNYIMGNPPFVGKKYQSPQQKEDMKLIFCNQKRGVGNLDYVTAWYRKAIHYMQSTDIVAAFVSTNSICQGEHVPLFWRELCTAYSIQIRFAYQTFIWESEASLKASVHCVIVGFSAEQSTTLKRIYSSSGEILKAQNIHPYLIDMPNIFVENRSVPISAPKPLVYGSFALDDGNYTISANEFEELTNKDADLLKFFKLFIGSQELINNKKRYCIWLKDMLPNEIRNNHFIWDRVNKVKSWRAKSGRKETVAASSTPALFAEIRQPKTDYMAIPITSSERRRYIPIGYLSKDVIASNHLLVLPDADFYEFGLLISNVHMAWMRTVAGRLKSDYNYSARIVYNNFPWPNPTEAQKEKIAKTAQAILDVRAKYPDSSLADLYDDSVMPFDLLKAHRANDRAVMEAYGFWGKLNSEAACVAELMKMYQQLVEKAK